MKTVLKPIQVRALEALATYRFLCRRQLQRVGVAKDPKDIRNDLKPLINKRWIGRTENPPTLDTFGRLDHLYWLYQAGANVLAELHGTDPVKVRTHEFTNRLDLPHMYAIIDVHIALRTWAASTGATVNWFKADYEPGLSRNQKATSLPYTDAEGRTKPYIPDAVAEVTLADGIPRLLVIEVYRGGWRNTLSHFWDALPMLRHVATESAVEAHFSHTNAARFLIVFFDPDMRDQALSRWRDASNEVFDDFYVKHLDELEPDFAGAWQQPSRPPRGLF